MELNELTFDMADVFNELVVVVNTSLIGRKAGPFLSIVIVLGKVDILLPLVAWLFALGVVTGS